MREEGKEGGHCVRVGWKKKIQRNKKYFEEDENEEAWTFFDVSMID